MLKSLKKRVAVSAYPVYMVLRKLLSRAYNAPASFGYDLLPLDILRAVLKDRPFIIVRWMDGHRTHLEICNNQNELEAFIPSLTALALGSPFIRGLQSALKGDPYEAALAFFEWVQTTEHDASAHVFDGREKLFPGYYRYPIFIIGDPGPATPSAKVELLSIIFVAYEQSVGNDRTRILILESLAFALSRSLGAHRQYARAIDFVRRALTLQPSSFYLPICLYTLERKLRDLSTPKRLEKFVGEDLKALDHLFCDHPFTRIEISPVGNIHVCCPELVPSHIGNIENESVAEATQSEMARRIRASILDGSYRYCNPVHCRRMIADTLTPKNDTALFSDPTFGPAIRERDATRSVVREVVFGYDPSCNLSCPSCRREVVIDNQKQSRHRSDLVTAHIIPILPNLRLLYINTGGEFLFSRPSRQLLLSIRAEAYSALAIDFISNGTLFSKSEWDKFVNIHDRVRNIRISTDAATKATFETVRRGGTWERFVDNLQFIAALRRSGKIKHLLLAFTYQLANFREMIEFVAFSEAVGADQVSFEALMPSSAMTPEEFSSRAVHSIAHPLHAEFLEVLKDQCFGKSRVIADWMEPGHSSRGAN